MDVDEGSDYYYGVAQPVYAYFAQGVDGAGYYASSVDVDEGSDYFYGLAQPVYAYFARGVDGAGYYASSVDVLEGEGTYYGVSTPVSNFADTGSQGEGFYSVVSSEDEKRLLLWSIPAEFFLSRYRNKRCGIL